MYDEIRKQIWDYYQKLLEMYKNHPCGGLRDEINFTREEIRMWKRFSGEAP